MSHIFHGFYALAAQTNPLANDLRSALTGACSGLSLGCLLIWQEMKKDSADMMQEDENKQAARTTYRHFFLIHFVCLLRNALFSCLGLRTPQTVNAYDYRHKLLRTFIGRNTITDICVSTYVCMCDCGNLHALPEFVGWLSYFTVSTSSWRIIQNYCVLRNVSQHYFLLMFECEILA